MMAIHLEFQEQQADLITSTMSSMTMVTISKRMTRIPKGHSTLRPAADTDQREQCGLPDKDLY